MLAHPVAHRRDWCTASSAQRECIRKDNPNARCTRAARPWQQRPPARSSSTAAHAVLVSKAPIAALSDLHLGPDLQCGASLPPPRVPRAPAQLCAGEARRGGADHAQDEISPFGAGRTRHTAVHVPPARRGAWWRVRCLGMKLDAARPVALASWRKTGRRYWYVCGRRGHSGSRFRSARARSPPGRLNACSRACSVLRSGRRTYIWRGSCRGA
jgi:hypothetical protein